MLPRQSMKKKFRGNTFQFSLGNIQPPNAQELWVWAWGMNLNLLWSSLFQCPCASVSLLYFLASPSYEWDEYVYPFIPAWFNELATEGKYNGSCSTCVKNNKNSKHHSRCCSLPSIIQFQTIYFPLMKKNTNAESGSWEGETKEYCERISFLWRSITILLPGGIYTSHFLCNNWPSFLKCVYGECGC